MKKTGKLIAALFICTGTALLLSACSKSSSGSGSVVGKWEAKSEHSVVIDSSTNPLTETIMDTTLTLGRSLTKEYKSNNTYVYTSDYTVTPVVQDSGTYITANGKLITTSFHTTSDTVSYTVSGSTLTTVGKYYTPPYFKTVTDVYIKD